MVFINTTIYLEHNSNIFFVLTVDEMSSYLNRAYALLLSIRYVCIHGTHVIAENFYIAWTFHCCFLHDNTIILYSTCGFLMC
jgi:hypothetical protein